MAQNIRYAKGTLKRFLFARLRTSSGQLYLGSRRSFPIPQLPSSLMTMMLPKGPAPAEKRPSVPFGSRNIVIIDGGSNSPRHELDVKGTVMMPSSYLVTRLTICEQGRALAVGEKETKLIREIKRFNGFIYMSECDSPSLPSLFIA